MPPSLVALGGGERASTRRPPFLEQVSFWFEKALATAPHVSDALLDVGGLQAQSCASKAFQIELPRFLLGLGGRFLFCAHGVVGSTPDKEFQRIEVQTAFRNAEDGDFGFLLGFNAPGRLVPSGAPCLW